MMAESFGSKQCTALTKSGDQCMNKAIEGSEFCHVHAGLTPTEEIELSPLVIEGHEASGDSDLQRQLIEEMDELVMRMREVIPDYSPPPPESGYGAHEDEPSDGQASASPKSLLDRVMGVINNDLRDPETWRGLWYMASYTLEYQGDIIKRRITGDYETDEWGLDWEVVEATRPFIDFLYNYFWRVECIGLDNIPDYDRTLMVCNQTDQPHWDPILVMGTLLNEHPAQRLVRNLYPAEIPTLPFISSLMVKMGQAVDSTANGVRLLEQEELVCVYPEHVSPFDRSQRDRTKVARFKDTGFVQMSMQSRSPLIPVAITSAADNLISRSDLARQRLDQPPTIGNILRFPRRRLNSPMPLPGKTTITFGEPVFLEAFDGEASKEPVYISKAADKIRSIIQEMMIEAMEQEETVSS
jgi:1-acyl-sn-glycerol-3-phosphate acyltransferase